MSSPALGVTWVETEGVICTDSCSETATTPGAGSSITLFVATGVVPTCLVSTDRSACFFLGAGFLVLIPARWALDFTSFRVACFATILRAGLAFALPRFELFLRAATRFFALAMSISLRDTRARVISPPVSYVHSPQPIRHDVTTIQLQKQGKTDTHGVSGRRLSGMLRGAEREGMELARA
jgi:hypothetical protein